MQAKLDELKKSKLAARRNTMTGFRRFNRKSTACVKHSPNRSFVASLEKTYVVGSWKKNRDCLWNISKKKDIYNNPFMWPKIWQGNRDQIKDPDIIRKGQRLKIPTAGSLTDSEKKAERKYWAKKRVSSK